MIYRNLLFLFYLISLLWSHYLHANNDTVTLYDYTKVMVKPIGDQILPVTNLNQTNHAGFFLEDTLSTFLICNENDLYIWISGRLVDKFKGCKVINFSDYEFPNADTLFISLSSKKGLGNLRCETVLFEKFNVLAEDFGKDRKQTSISQNKWVWYLLLCLFFITIYFKSFPSSFRKEFRVMLSLGQKRVEPESLWNVKNLFKHLIISLTVSFWILILREHQTIDIFTDESTFSKVLIKTTALIMGMLTFRKLIGDFILNILGINESKINLHSNFILFLAIIQIPIFGIYLFNVVLGYFENIWQSDAIFYWVSFSLIFFSFWISLKFITNYSHSKLSIITYLCIIEYLPTVLIVSWFFK